MTWFNTRHCNRAAKFFLKAFITAVWNNRVVLKKVIQLRYITILQFYSDVHLQIPNRLEIDRFSSYCTRVTYVVGCLLHSSTFTKVEAENQGPFKQCTAYYCKPTFPIGNSRSTKFGNIFPCNIKQHIALYKSIKALNGRCLQLILWYR